MLTIKKSKKVAMHPVSALNSIVIKGIKFTLRAINFLSFRLARVRVILWHQSGATFPKLSTFESAQLPKVESHLSEYELSIQEFYLRKYTLPKSTYQETNGFTELFKDSSGFLTIKKNGQVLVSALALYLESSEDKAIQWLSISSVQRVDNKNDSVIYLKTMAGLCCQLTLKETRRGEVFSISAKLWSSVACSSITAPRVSIILDVNASCIEAAGLNGKVEVLENPTYLGREGKFKLTSGNIALLKCSNSSFSSTLIDPEKKRVILNVDWSLDHPKIQYNPAEQFYKNVSARRLKGHETIEAELTLMVVKKEMPFFAQMPIPDGYHSMHCFTVHGCFISQSTLQTLLFGGKNTKGMVERDLGCTVSLFYSNLEKRKNNMTDLSSKKPEDQVAFSISNSDESFAFYKEMALTPGVEVALHSFDDIPYSEDAVSGVFDKLSTHQGEIRSFIDHIWYKEEGVVSGPVDNCVNGVGSTSCFAETLLHRGVRYWWSAAQEYIAPNSFASFYLCKFNFVDSKGGLPCPVLFYDHEHPNTTKPPVWFTTNKSWYPKVETSLQDRLSIVEATNRWGYFFNHCYLGYACGTNDVCEETSTGFELTQNFSRFLDLLEDLKNQGRLWVPKLSEAIEYWESLNGLELDLKPIGSGWRLEIIAEVNVDGYTLHFPVSANATVTSGKLKREYIKFNRKWLIMDLVAGEKLTLEIY